MGELQINMENSYLRDLMRALDELLVDLTELGWLKIKRVVVLNSEVRSNKRVLGA